MMSKEHYIKWALELANQENISLRRLINEKRGL
jgi:desulfoferrodoxin (superoxide reductase-like protein)